jgi:hypothetical protein
MNPGQKQLIEQLLQKAPVTNTDIIEFFKTTKLANAFVDVLFDNILYKQKNLPYFVSSQLQKDDVPTLYRSLRNNLILPVLRKYQYYSPTMIIELVKKICNYVATYYGHPDSYSIDDLFKITHAQKVKYADIIDDLELYKLEQSVWSESSF